MLTKNVTEKKKKQQHPTSLSHNSSTGQPATGIHFAIKLLQDGRFLEAEEISRELYKKNPNQAEVLHLLDDDELARLVLEEQIRYSC